MIEFLVVHCSASPQNRGDDAKTIHRWHKERDWSGIGYHYVILETGEVQAGRPEYWTGAHVRGYNSRSLGICLIGDGEYTDNQLESLRSKLRLLKHKYPNAKICGHRDLDDKKDCPKFDVQDWWENY